MRSPALHPTMRMQPLATAALGVLCYSLACAAAGNTPGIEYDFGVSPKFVCTPVPPEADPACFSPPLVPKAPSANGNDPSGGGLRGLMSDEAKTTILHLRESLVRQKETILDQRETIRELTAKLTLCEGFGGHHGGGHHGNHHGSHDSHHDHHHSSHHSPSTYHSSDNRVPLAGSPEPDPLRGKVSAPDKPASFSPEQTGKTLQSLKERLENLQARNSTSSYSSSLRELLQRKIHALEEQLHSYHSDHHANGHHNDHHGENNHSSTHHTDTHHGSPHHGDTHHGSPHHSDTHHGSPHHSDTHHGSGHHDGHHYDGHHGRGHYDSHHDNGHHGNYHHTSSHSSHHDGRRPDDHHGSHYDGNHDHHHGYNDNHHSSHHGMHDNHHRPYDSHHGYHGNHHDNHYGHHENSHVDNHHGNHHGYHDNHHGNHNGNHDNHHGNHDNHHGNHNGYHDNHHGNHNGYHDNHHGNHNGYHDNHHGTHNGYHDNHHGNHNGYHDNHHGNHNGYHDNHHGNHNGYHDNHHGNHNGHHENHHGNHNSHHDDPNIHPDHQHNNSNHDDPQDNHRDQRPLPPGSKDTGVGHTRLETVLSQLHNHGNQKKSSGAFLLDFPMRSNYMYARMKPTLLTEIFAMTVCLRMKAGAGPGVGTPFSYAVNGQANELVLREGGDNPMELLINDQLATLPITLSDGEWHHVCVTWTTRDGTWEAFQDGVKTGSGEKLSPWQPIQPGGVFVLGQLQDSMEGGFDVTQSFLGGLSDLQLWSRVLSGSEVVAQASCGRRAEGDLLPWSEEHLDLHGGLAVLPFHRCP